MEPSVCQQVADRTAQREKLRQFFLAQPETFWTQDTLAEACGADVGAVRTRINELKREGMSLIGKYADYRDKDNVWHRGKKVWMYQPRPEEPLGRDAGTCIPGDVNTGTFNWDGTPPSGWQEQR